MKKVLVFMLVICFCFGMIGCTPTQNNELTAYKSEAVYYPTPSRLSPKMIDADIGNAFCVKENMPDKILEIQGVEYVGKYEYTAYAYQGFLKVDCYFANGINVQFAFFENTDNLAYFNQIIDPLKEPYTPEDSSLYLKAYEIAKGYVENISEYELDSTSVPKMLGFNSGYYANEYTFTKKVQGYSTTDCFYMILTYSGKIEKLVIGQLGAFDNCPQIDKTEISDSLDLELSQVYEINGTKITDVMYREEKLLRQEDGRIVLLSNAWLCVSLSDGGKAMKSTSLLTPIDRQGYGQSKITHKETNLQYSISADEAYTIVNVLRDDIWKKMNPEKIVDTAYEFCIYGVKFQYSTDGYFVDGNGNYRALSNNEKSKINDLLKTAFLDKSHTL